MSDGIEILLPPNPIEVFKRLKKDTIHTLWG